MREHGGERQNEERRKRKKLLGIDRYSENRKLIACRRRNDTASEKRCAKTKHTAYTVFYCGCLHEILGVYTAVGYVKHISAKSGVAYIIQGCIKNYHKS